MSPPGSELLSFPTLPDAALRVSRDIFIPSLKASRIFTKQKRKCFPVTGAINRAVSPPRLSSFGRVSLEARTGTGSASTPTSETGQQSHLLPVVMLAGALPHNHERGLRTEIKYGAPGVKMQGTPTRTLWLVHSPLKLGSLGLRLMLQKWPGLKLINNYIKASGYKVNIQVNHFPKNKRNLELKAQSQFI